jgi:hypothetical protein
LKEIDMTANDFPDYRPKAVTGMAFGTLMLTLFGCLWLAMGFQAMNLHSAWLTVLLVLFAASLLVPCAGMFRIGRQAEKYAGPLSPEQGRDQKRMGSSFGLVFAAEGVLILLAVNVLNNLHLEHYVISAIAAIVGLHFVPLARLYRVGMYYTVGSVMTVAAILSLAVPSPLRESSLALTMGTILWMTCAALIQRGLRLGRATLADHVHA